MDEKTIDMYNQLALEYDAETVDFWEWFPRMVIDTFAENTHGTVLDVGCGPGRDGLLLEKAGLDVICLDASKAMVQIAKERGLKTIQGDFCPLPFNDESFDGVWAYTSLLHIPKSDIGKALSEIQRVLKPGGTFGLGMIEGDSEAYRESSGVGKPRWFSFYTKEELDRLLEAHGFTEIYFETFEPRSKKYLNFVLRKQ